MMSWSRSAGLLEAKGAVSVNFSLKAFLADGLFDDFYSATQDLRKASLQIVQVTEIIETSFGKILAQPHHYVDIICVILGTRYGTEQGRTLYASSPELCFVLL